MSLSDFGFLVQNFAALVDWRYVAMWVIGGVLIFLAVKYEMEPTLLLPLGFGTILAVSYTHLDVYKRQIYRRHTRRHN